MLVLAAVYGLILILLIRISNSWVWEKTKEIHILAIIGAAIDSVLFLGSYLIERDPLLLVSTVFPAVILWASVCDWKRDVRESPESYYFSIPAGAYTVEQNLGMDFYLEPRMKVTTGILWDGKLILMPSTFSGRGEALELICSRKNTNEERYFCRKIRIKEQRRDIWKTLVSASLIAAVLALPACMYLSVTTGSMFGKEMGEALLTCLVFGFAWLVLRGGDKKRSLVFMRIIMGVGYGIGILAVILAAAGNVS